MVVYVCFITYKHIYGDDLLKLQISTFGYIGNLRYLLV